MLGGSIPTKLADGPWTLQLTHILTCHVGNKIIDFRRKREARVDIRLLTRLKLFAQPSQFCPHGDTDFRTEAQTAVQGFTRSVPSCAALLGLTHPILHYFSVNTGCSTTLFRSIFQSSATHPPTPLLPAERQRRKHTQHLHWTIVGGTVPHADQIQLIPWASLLQGVQGAQKAGPSGFVSIFSKTWVGNFYYMIHSTCTKYL